MTLTREIYEELLSSSDDGKKQISKRYDIAMQYLIYAASKRDKIRHLYFIINEDDLDSIPACNGIEMDLVKLPEYDANSYFCNLKQAQGSESYIFETIVEDIRLKTSEKPGTSIVAIVAVILRKWKEFFAKNRELIISSERQQGLYGELRFLEYLIRIKGEKAVNYWTGCNYETHDFYVDSNAIEIKTTSTKAPYKMHISSEYQLDDKEVEGQLFLKFYALRKSESDGEKLGEIITRIRDVLKNNPHALLKFNEKLEEYGYFDAVAEKYTTGYSDRMESIYNVCDNFPRITAKDLTQGISNCLYDLSVDQCIDYTVEVGELKLILEREGNNGR